MTKPPHDVIDVHSHALPQSWVAAIAEAMGISTDNLAVAGVKLPPWSAQEHVAFMDRCGIAACVLSQPTGTVMRRGQTARQLARAINEEYAEIIARYPGRFGAFATLPLDDMDAANEEMAYALDVLGLDGVACNTQYRGVYLGDPVYEQWFAEMNRRQVTLFAHPAEPAAFDQVDIGLNVSVLEFMFDSTRMVSNLIISGAKARFSDITIISTHGGGTIPFLAGRLELAEPYFGAGQDRPTLTREEIEQGLASFHYDLTAATAPAALDAIRRLVPASQLMLGYDYPMMPESTTPPSMAEFDAYDGFGDAERQLIRSQNALRLFPRLARRRAALTTTSR